MHVDLFVSLFSSIKKLLGRCSDVTYKRQILVVHSISSLLVRFFQRSIMAFIIGIYQIRSLFVSRFELQVKTIKFLLIIEIQMNFRAILTTLVTKVLPVASFILQGPLLITTLLRLFGFSSIGPVAGSFAAFIQSFFYGGAVASGSIFAILQKIAMTWGGAMSWGGAAASGFLTILRKIVTWRRS